MTIKNARAPFATARAAALEPVARAHFLRSLQAGEVLAMHRDLVGEPKPKTPRPVLERRVLAALEARPVEPEAAPQPAPAPTEPPAVEAQQDASTAAPEDGERRLPPVGTVIEKRDRKGQLRASCKVVEGERVEYAGKVTSISGAAVAAARDLGLQTKTLNGWTWWDGLDARAPRPRKEKAPKDHTEGLGKAWGRYAALVRAAIADDPKAVASLIGGHCNAHNELVAAAITGAAPAA